MAFQSEATQVDIFAACDRPGAQQLPRLRAERLLEEAALDPLQLHQPPVLHLRRRPRRAGARACFARRSRASLRRRTDRPTPSDPTPPHPAATRTRTPAPRHTTPRHAPTRQMPVMLYNHLGELLEGGWAISGELALCLLLNGACFHMQSVMAYAVMGLISPVSQARARAPLSRPRGRPDLQSRVGTPLASASASLPLPPSLALALSSRPLSRARARAVGRQHAQARAAHLAVDPVLWQPDDADVVARHRRLHQRRAVVQPRAPERSRAQGGGAAGRGGQRGGRRGARAEWGGQQGVTKWLCTRFRQTHLEKSTLPVAPAPHDSTRYASTVYFTLRTLIRNWPATLADDRSATSPLITSAVCSRSNRSSTQTSHGCSVGEELSSSSARCRKPQPAKRLF